MSFTGKGYKPPKPTTKVKAKSKIIKAKFDLAQGKIAKKDYAKAANIGSDRAKKSTRKGAGGKTMS